MSARIMHSTTRRVDQIIAVVHEQDYRVHTYVNETSSPTYVVVASGWLWHSRACHESCTSPNPAGSEEVAPTFAFSLHLHGSSKRVAPRRNPQRASAQLLLSVYYWFESQLRWRLRHPTIPRRAHPRAEWSVSAPGRGTGQGKHLRCWEVQRQR